MDELMTMEQTCAALGFSKDTFYSLCRKGELPAVKIGRRWYVSKAELMRVVNERLEQMQAKMNGGK